MSGIAGIFYRDGRPAERAEVARMVDAIVHRGPDGAGVWVDGPVGLGHCMLHTTPESLHERLPLTSRCGNYTITADARIDNRDELIPLLGLTDRPRELIGDTEVILAAYQRWGERCPEKLLGDFAFAIWDARRRELFCARDFIGVRPFYYYVSDKLFVFGSELGALFSCLEVPRFPNQKMVAEYLLSSVNSKQETLFKKVMRLAPGHVVFVQSDEMRNIDVPVIDFFSPVRYNTDQGYFEHFSNLLNEAVGCRLRSVTPIGSHLSGGLDSSSVAAATKFLCSQEGYNYNFELYSQIFPGLSCDESCYIDGTSKKLELVSNRVTPHVLGIEYYREQASRYYDFPDYPNGGYMGNPLSVLARKKGVRVMLTGHGGNQWLEGQFEHLADLFLQKNFGRWMRQCRGVTYAFDQSWKSLLLDYSIKPLMPFWLFQLIRKLARRQDNVPGWIDYDLYKESSLANGNNELVDYSHFDSYGQAATYSNATSGWLVHAYEIGERRSMQFEVEERHPLNDRRIIQFALNIPCDQIWRGEKVKYVMRQSMRELLPINVIERIFQSQFSALFYQTFRAIDIVNFCSDLEIAKVGWVDSVKVREMAEQSVSSYSSKEQRFEHMWHLCGVMGIELWYKSAIMNMP